jgi:hypothetical protein
MLRLVLVLALVLPASASAKFVFFQTPSHNIGCAYSSSPASLRCDIRSGLKPAPPKPKGCQNDWTFGYSVNATGRAHNRLRGRHGLLPDRPSHPVRQDMARRRFHLQIEQFRTTLPQPERPRALPQPAALVSLLT